MNFYLRLNLFCLILLTVGVSGVLGQERVPPVPLPPDEEIIYKVVEEMPRFPGCEDMRGSAKDKENCAKEKMVEFIDENLVYPKEAKRLEVEGFAVIQFTIWKDSTIRNIKIVRDPGSGTGEAAAKVVELMSTLRPKWRPGYQKGMPVSVQYTLPVKFKIEGLKRKSKRGININLPRKRNPEAVYTIRSVHEYPIFPDCNKLRSFECTERSLEEFIQENMIYPEAALENGTEGEVIVSFIIEIDGSLSNIKTLNKLPDGLCKDAIEIFKWMNSQEMRWTPGKVKYEPVRTFYEARVNYSITEWGG